MDKIRYYQHIASLILKQKLEELDDNEAKELREWMEADTANGARYRRLQKSMETQDLTHQHIDSAAAYGKYRRRYHSRPARSFFRYVAAAMIFLLLGFSGLFFYRTVSTDSGREKHAEAPIIPGYAKAVLTLGNGTMINLNTSGNKIIRTDGTLIRNDSSCIDYTTPATPGATNHLNELRTPAGGEYQLVMADGTSVWLNAQTRLRYPEHFTQMERTVWLEGEAYFEVAKDSKRPFRIMTKDDVCIEVLGTSFNVRSYQDESMVETVLEKGSVRVARMKDTVILSPGMRGLYEHNTDRITTGKVDTRPYTAWRSGQFVFYEETVESILKKLSRWYDINIFYRNESVKQMVFSGNVRKYDDINTLLEAMEMVGGIAFEVKGRTLIVRSANN